MKELAAENEAARQLDRRFGCAECPQLKVAILYDELSAGRQALTEVRNASRSLGDRRSLDLRLWRFDLLSDDILAELAIREIINADVVLISIDRKASHHECTA